MANYYYERPTPMDVLHEENDNIIHNSYNGKSVYEWNIDGLSDAMINNQMHRMLMYSCACKTCGVSDIETAQAITVGFHLQESLNSLKDSLKEKIKDKNIP